MNIGHPDPNGGPADPARMSPIAAGVWRMAEWGFNVQERLAWIEQSLDMGITTFDHADIYGGYTVEDLFGQALALAPGLRARMQLVTKCGIRLVSPQRPAHRLKSYDTSSAHVRASVEHSLRALRTEHIDLLLIHRPDCLMDPQELASTFEALHREGKVGAFGVSNHTPSQLSMLHRRVALSAHQIEFSALQMQALADGTLDQCMELGLRPMIWSPLAGGRLFSEESDQARRVRKVLADLAHAHGVSVSTIAYAWILRHPSRPVPLTGTRRAQAMREAVAALTLRLTAQEWYSIWEASMGHPVP